MAGRMLIERTASDSSVALVLHGELDLASVAELQAELDALTGQNAANVIVDLRGVTFVDSTGLRVLLRARQAALSRNRRLLLRNVPSQARAVMDMTRTRGYFEIVD
jgi:anti-anti-sigma factor